jgi:hypothetical protein
MGENDQPRMSAEELEQKLEEYTREMTPEFLRKRLRLSIYKKVQAADITALDDLEKLEKYEAKLAKVTPGAAATASPQSASPDPASGGADTPSEEDEIGIPQALRVKRHYTVSDKVIEQRRAAARAGRPGSEGNKRNWKGGLFAKDFIEGRIKPCQSTCPIFNECELVSEGYTKPDGVCLDKAAVIATYEALMNAIKHKEYDEFNSVSALMISETMHVCRSLLEDVMRDGGVCKREKRTKDGITIEYVAHPALFAIPKLIADLGLTPREMLVTPKAVKDDEQGDEVAKTAAGLMSDMARRQREQRGGAKGEDHEE